MLKNRNFLWLGIVLVVLVGASVLQSVAHRRAVTRPVQASLLQTALDRDAVTRIVLGHGADSLAVVIERLPDKWVVRTAYGHPAADARVSDLLRNLAELRGEFRSDEASVLPDYGLDAATAVSITVFGKDFKPALSLLVGKKPMGAIGDFVRRPGSNAVYLTGASLLSNLGLWGGPARPKSSHFLDLQAWKTERDQVNALVLDDNGKVVELLKEFPPAPAPTASADTAKAAAPDRTLYEWRMKRPKDKPALKTKADAVLGSLVSVRAADVADPTVNLMEYGLWKAARKVDVGLADGSTVTLFFGATRPEAGDVPGGVFMRTSLDKTIWVVRESFVSALFPKPEDLVAQ